MRKDSNKVRKKSSQLEFEIKIAVRKKVWNRNLRLQKKNKTNDMMTSSGRYWKRKPLHTRSTRNDPQ